MRADSGIFIPALFKQSVQKFWGEYNLFHPVACLEISDNFSIRYGYAFFELN